MFLLIDNYDSFTYNLWHYLGTLGAEVEVIRNDHLTVEEILGRHPRGVILSPGPCDPDRAGVCVPLVRALPPTLPLFGVCLGHQTLGQVFGAPVVRSPEPMHGKVSEVHHDGSGVFAHLPATFIATRYHSLELDRAHIPETLVVNAWCADGTVMGVRHRDRPLHGVQFHPESIASEHGMALLANFLRLAGGRPAAA